MVPALRTTTNRGYTACKELGCLPDALPAAHCMLTHCSYQEAHSTCYIGQILMVQMPNPQRDSGGQSRGLLHVCTRSRLITAAHPHSPLHRLAERAPALMS